MTTPATKPALYQFYDSLKRLHEPGDFDKALAALKEGKGWFIEIKAQGKMGLARTALINRANACGYYKVRDDTFRKHHDAP